MEVIAGEAIHRREGDLRGAHPQYAERHLAGQYPVARQKKTQRFRSTLELIQLMDSALDSRGPDEKAFAAWDDSDAGTVPAQKQEEKENA